MNLTEAIKVIIPEGLRHPLAIDTKRQARFEIHDVEYRVKITAMLTKMPGFLFTGYQAAQFHPVCLVSEDQYKALLEDYIEKGYKSYRRHYNELIAGYNLTNGIPKFRMYIKLAPDISQERREFICNGVRAYFRTDGTILLDTADTLKTLNSSLTFFEIFIGIVGMIALIMAFFLLLISTTQNIKENVWEYGCLRSMGFKG